ncbi:MAG: nucleotidyl transferase AbiEii/AbiGii toxin family protein [Acidobacteria bacterium]|nr:nucleotidyl transferase AbiEii/AbiGii toxin family protein [Acidobacteriota bacterium]
MKIDRADLVTRYALGEFSVNVLSVKRTLVEKILGALKDSYHPDPVAQLSNRIRHLYDICLILRQKTFQDFVQSQAFQELVARCLAEEKQSPLNAAWLDHDLSQAPLFKQFSTWLPRLDATYRGLFSDLVYGTLPPMEEIAERLSLIQDHLLPPQKA